MASVYSKFMNQCQLVLLFVSLKLVFFVYRELKDSSRLCCCCCYLFSLFVSSVLIFPLNVSAVSGGAR